MDTRSDAQIRQWVEDRLERLAPSRTWQPDSFLAFGRFKEARAIGTGRRRTWSVALAGLGVVCLSLVAFPTTRVFAARCVVACVGQTSRVGRWIEDGGLGSGRTALDVNRLGAMAPDFTRSTAAGESIALASFRGQVVLLNFWATWCPPCANEMPWFVEFQETYRRRGFTVMGVALDEDGWASVTPFLQQKGVNYPVVMGDDNLSRLYGNVSALPTTLIIDRSGHVASTHIGIVEKNEYERDIRAALNRKWTNESR